MPRQEAPLEYLQRFIPAASVPQTLQLLHQYKVHLTITRNRKSVLGDYRHADGQQAHRISINDDLNKYAFLITLIHELAHLVTFENHGHGVLDHGQEWKYYYAGLLRLYLAADIFPNDVRGALEQSLHNPPASSCSDETLMRQLKKYDRPSGDRVWMETLPEGALFHTGDGKIFRKGKQLRKRFQCEEMGTGRLYLFHPLHEVNSVKPPPFEEANITQQQQERSGK